MPRISIVIPTLGRTDALRAVLDALGRQRIGGGQAEAVVVVDAAATPPAWLTEYRTAGSVPVRIEHARGPGASAARNVGWRSAKSELVLFLDDDIVPAPRLLSEHLSWHERETDEHVAVLGLVEWSPEVAVTPFMRWLETGIQFDYASITGTESEWWRFYSCNVSVKRSLLHSVDGFDEKRFPFGYEDLDIAYRMSARGLRLLFARDARGEHLKTETLETWRHKLGRIAVSERRFVERYPEHQPYFRDRFADALARPRARGRTARLARFVSPETPWIGPIVWRSFDLVCWQQLAPDFLGAWDRAAADTADQAPATSNRAHA